MRLSELDRAVIKEIISRFIPEGEIYLFGSRADDAKLGGDIDLLITSSAPVSLRCLRAIKIHLKDRLGDQKIDLVAEIHNRLTPFGTIIRSEGIRL